MTHLKQLKILINGAIVAMNDAPVIDAENVAEYALKQWPPESPQPDGLGDKLRELAADILRKRFDPIERVKKGRVTTGLIGRYFAVLETVGDDDFDHPKLEAIRRLMSEQERNAVIARLQAEDEAAAKELEALMGFGRSKGWSRPPSDANDNPSS